MNEPTINDYSFSVRDISGPQAHISVRLMRAVEIYPEMEIETPNESSEFKPCMDYYSA